MPPSALHHRRAHNLLLINKLLDQRDATSPFTLLLDSVEQSGRPLVREYIRRAKAAGVNTIFVSFETLRKPKDVDVFISAWESGAKGWEKELNDHLKGQRGKRTLVLIDSLNPLATISPTLLPSLLSSFISPTTSLLATYHTDIPLPARSQDPYAPSPSTLLRYLATTILTTHSLHHVLAAKSARERSVVPPKFGLEEGVEGVVQGLGANGREGVVVEMEHRRKSGRGLREMFYLPITPKSAGDAGKRGRPEVILLEDHPEYRTQTAETGAEGDDAEGGTTFELGLTEKQRRDREGVVLPYYDAQKGGGGQGPGEGGRILYDMGSEDDFDEEEDEI